MAAKLFASPLLSPPSLSGSCSPFKDENFSYPISRASGHPAIPFESRRRRRCDQVSRIPKGPSCHNPESREPTDTRDGLELQCSYQRFGGRRVAGFIKKAGNQSESYTGSETAPFPACSVKHPFQAARLTTQNKAPVAT